MTAGDDDREAMNSIVPNKGTFVPFLSTIVHSPLGDALFGRVRGRVLALFFGHPQQEFYTRQVIQAVGAGQGAVQRELKDLSAAGMLIRARRGREVYYRANPQCPIYAELVRLMLKTLGLADTLRAALADIGREVRIAFVYGSMASGTSGVRSDVDVMVVGQASFAQVVAALAPTQDVLGREVNPSVYSIVEFRGRAAQGDHFVTSVLREPKLFLIGGQDELDRLAD
jgi:predicted nucleotidyltransferase